MGRWGTRCWLVFFLLATPLSIWAQSGQPKRPISMRPSQGSSLSRSTLSTPSVRTATPSRLSTVSRIRTPSTTRIGSTRSTLGSTLGSRSRISTPSTGRDPGGSTYSDISSNLRRWHGYYYNPLGLYYCDRFFARLFFEYGYLSRHDYLWTYAQGSPMLTEDVARLALRKTSELSHRLDQAIASLQRNLQLHRQSQLSRHELQDRVDATINTIRSLNKSLREDFYLDYLDQRKRGEVQSFQLAQSPQELQNLMGEMQRLARQIQIGITSYYERDQARVVSVADLSQPSFRSLSKGIDRLAKKIKKSVRRL